MFEHIRLSQSAPQAIELQTRRCRSIPNDMPLAPSERDRFLYGVYQERYGSDWKHRKDACGTYNCFGHLFASRRTAIREDKDVYDVLEDDGFRKLNDAELPMPSDCVLYITRNILHVGKITRLETKFLDSITPFSIVNRCPKEIWVLSKWSDCYGEDEHLITDTQLTRENAVDQIEIWTDR